MSTRSSRGRPRRKFGIGRGRCKRGRKAIERDVPVMSEVDGTW